MRNIFLLVTIAILASPAGATLIKRHQQGARVAGTTYFSAQHKNAAVRGEGVRNEARNSVGVIRSGTQIRGDTSITASQSNATAIASGSGNVAANEAGVIGGR